MRQFFSSLFVPAGCRPGMVIIMKLNHMIRITLPFCLAVMFLAGCGAGSTSSVGSTDSEESYASSSATDEEENPFEMSEDAETLGGSMQTFLNVELDGEDEPIPFTYNGGTMEVGFQYSGYGTAKNVGFLVFLDGVPQLWQMNGEGETSYMHYLELGDDETCSFTITFTPVTGQQGDTLELNVCSVYYAQYQPDMTTTYYFGSYHNLVSSLMQISFITDVTDSYGTSVTTDALQDVVVTSNQMTSDFSDSLLEMYEACK